MVRTKSKIKRTSFKLRREGKSYREISNILSIPKSTLSGWFSKEDFSIEIKRNLTQKQHVLQVERLRLMAKANHEKWQLKYLQYRKTAREQFGSNFSDPIFLVGLALYWGEGDKRMSGTNVRISNIDPRILKIFINFLIKCCHVKRASIKVWLLLYPDLVDIDCKKFWSKKLNIGLENFYKSQYIQGRKKKDKLSYGVCNVTYSSRELKEQIMEWLDMVYHNFDAGIV